jgi:hypothetical protein
VKQEGASYSAKEVQQKLAQGANVVTSSNVAGNLSSIKTAIIGEDKSYTTYTSSNMKPGDKLNMMPGDKLNMMPGDKVNMMPGDKVNMMPGDKVNMMPGEKVIYHRHEEKEIKREI